MAAAPLLSVCLSTACCADNQPSPQGALQTCLMVERDPEEVLGSATLVPALVVAEAGKLLSPGFRVSLSD